MRETGTLSYPPTILEAAQTQGLELPVSHNDLVSLVQELARRGVVTNVSSEPWWKAYETHQAAACELCMGSEVSR